MNAVPLDDVLRTTLARRAEDALPPAYDVDALVARGEERLRRRRAGIIAGSVAAVVVAIVIALVGSALTAGTKDTERPVVHPTPTQTPSALPLGDTARRVVWSEIPYSPERGLVHDRGRLHVGERVLELEHAFVAIDATDDGVVWVDRRAEVWFSDGVHRERIGRKQCLGGEHGFPNAVVTDNVGSRAVWFECTDPRIPTLVVYDTQDRGLLLVPVARCARGNAFCGLEAVIGDHVYWQWYDYRHGRTRFVRYDVATDARREVSESALEADRRDRYRALVKGRSWAEGHVEEGPDFRRRGARLVVPEDVFNPDSPLTSLWVAATGAPVKLRVPAGYHRAPVFRLTQWLGDDSVVLMAATEEFGQPEAWKGDLLRCRLSTGRCVQVHRGSGTYRVLLAPGGGLPG